MKNTNVRENDRKMHTMIAIPCMDTVPVEFMQSILYLNKPEGTKVCFNPGSLIYDSRNLISLSAIDNKCDRVLWLDSDMVFTPDTLTRLSNDMDELGCEMISGVYVKRKIPSTPVIYRHLDLPKKDKDGNLTHCVEAFTDYPKDTVFTIAGCGFGCVMMTTSLIKRVWDEFGPAFVPYPWFGEDISFCYRVNQLGVQIWCDSRVQCGHVGKYIYTDIGGDKH